MRKLECHNKHRMIQVVDELWLCECSSYGSLTDRLGAVDDARRLIDRMGGVESLRDQIIEKENAAKRERQELAKDRAKRVRDSIHQK